MKLSGVERGCVTNNLTALFPQSQELLSQSSIASQASGLEAIGRWKLNDV